MSTVLVVEDSISQRECISYQLAWSGIHVIQASDGVEALDKIQTTIPDLILLDIVMPKMDGYRVCRLLKANPATRNIPVVFLTGNNQQLAIDKGIKHAEAYVGKPWRPRELIGTIKRVLLHAKNSHSIVSADAWTQYALLIFKIIEIYQSRADSWSKYGTQLIKYYELCIAAFKQALDLDPTHLTARKYQKIITNQWELALKQLEQTTPCNICGYYYGRNDINCAVHPISRPENLCRDWDLNP